MTEPTDKELFDWLEYHGCSLMCWNVYVGPAHDANGWSVSGHDDFSDEEPRGLTAREAVAWAKQQHAAGKFRTPRDAADDRSGFE